LSPRPRFLRTNHHGRFEHGGRNDGGRSRARGALGDGAWHRDAIVSIVLAILIAIGWPSSSIGFIGLLTGFSLITAGVWRIMLARALRGPASAQPS
jgi:hypothetical protein